eukprot:Colp12_sorted_trinity150504_noHs@20301
MSPSFLRLRQLLRPAASFLGKQFKEHIPASSAFLKVRFTTNGSTSTATEPPKPTNPEDKSRTLKKPKVTQTHCPGCGVKFQTEQEEELGFIKPEKLNPPEETEPPRVKFVKMAPDSDAKKDDEIVPLICQRCFYLRYHNKIVNTKAPTFEETRTVLRKLRMSKGLVVCLVDLSDFPSSLPAGLNDLVGQHNSILLVGNKYDLIAKKRSDVVELNRIRLWLRESAKAFGVRNIVSTRLLSAFHNFGALELRQVIEKYRGRDDVYLVGSTNVGKSTLVNSLLEMYGRSRGSATVSNWPGTTLNVISFPIGFSLDTTGTTPLTAKDRHAWLHDTPGLPNPDHISSLLNKEELKVTSSFSALRPQTFLLKPGMSLFVSGLARLDYVEGADSAYFTVHAPHALDVHRTTIAKADEFYEKHVGTHLLQPPIGRNRKNQLPPLAGKDFAITCSGPNQSVSDIVFAGVGFVAVSGKAGMTAKVKGHTPGGLGLCMRDSILPFSVRDRGKRATKGETTMFKGKR